MPSTNAAANALNISANTKIVAETMPGRIIGRVTVTATRILPAPSTRALSSSEGSIDFIAAEIITKATVPSNSAITQAIPNGE